jgi:hypothetical protein
MRALKAGIIYGLLGFAAGFLFGALREMLFIPLFGDRAGHLIEFPLLMVLIFLIAAALIRRREIRSATSAAVVGVTGVAILLAVESTFALAVMGQSTDEYLAGFNVLNGELFPVGLAAMALAPVFFARRER